MRNYVIINGVNSNTIQGLAINLLPPITKPMMRTQIEEIDGRDGDIITELGYSAYDKEMEIGLWGTYDINQVISFFNGEGTITFSNESDKQYYFKIINQIDYEKLAKFKVATVTFHCQPFKYPTTETQIVTNGSTVNEEGTSILISNSNEGSPIESILKGDTQQNGTPTPSAPIPVETVTGEQAITVCGKNLFDKDNIVSGYRLDGSGNPSSSANNEFTSDFIPVESGTTYIRSYGNISAYTRTCFYDKDKSFVSKNDDSQSFTIPSNVKYIRFSEYLTRLDTMQLEKGSIATTYETYNGINYEINLGKNLFSIANATENYRLGSDGTPYADNSYILSEYISVEPSSTYTFSRGDIGGVYACICFYKKDKTFISRTTWGSVTTQKALTITTPSNAFYIRVTDFKNLSSSIQFERGYATSYAPYKTPIELCKLGDYQDRIYKDNGKWYLEKNIGKVVLNGSENWIRSGNTSENFFCGALAGVNIPFQAKTGTASDSKTNYFVKGNKNSNAEVFDMYNGTDYYTTFALYLSTNKASDVTTFKSWLNTHNTILYYVSITAEATEITDTELVSQLNQLANATTISSTTNIISIGNLPSILNISTTKIANTTINNIGNIYAKPLLTIFGEGDIGVYLNGTQVLQIALGNSEKITIDVSKMEAYNSDTDVLMNRMVTGDYMNFLIQSGNNTLSFTGSVTKLTMDNYTRWL